MSSASWLTITGADFATSSVSSKHQLMAGPGRNPCATMAFQDDPAWIAAHAEIFAASYLSCSSADVSDRPSVKEANASRFGLEFTGFFRCPDVAASS